MQDRRQFFINKYNECILKALDSFLKEESSLKTISEVIGYLHAYDCYIKNFEDYIGAFTIEHFVDKFKEVCEKFNIDYTMFHGLINAYNKCM